MKKFLFSLIALLVTAAAWSQTEYSTSVTLVDHNDEILTVTSIGLSDKKKDAVDMAIKSAFYTLFYRGVNGYNDDKPLVTKDNSYYFNNFMKSRFMMFVRDYSVQGEVENLKRQKQYKATVRVVIQIKSLVKDLVMEKLMEKPLDQITMQDTKEEIGLPSITVVPYKTDEQNYKEILQSDFDRRVAVSKVQDGFNKLGVNTVDFEAKLNAMWRSVDFNAATADSEEKRLLKNSGADVYVVVDIKKDISATEGSRVALIMTAYLTATGNVLASKQEWTNRFNTTALDQLVGIAVDGQLKDFLGDIKVNFARMIAEGNSVALHISKGENASADMNTEVDNSTLSNVIRRWVRENAQDGRYHIQGVVAEEMIFDDIKIPPKDVDGLPMDPAQFGDNLLHYITRTLKIPASMKLDGRTIYITVK